MLDENKMKNKMKNISLSDLILIRDLRREEIEPLKNKIHALRQVPEGWDELLRDASKAAEHEVLKMLEPLEVQLYLVEAMIESKISEILGKR